MRWKKGEKERRVADLFCRHLGKGWYVESDHRESPDFLISDGQERFGLELTELRQTGAQDEAIDYDRAFKADVCDVWLYDDSVNDWQVTFHYRLTQGGTYTVPRPKDRDQVITELRQLVRTVTPDMSEKSAKVRFNGDHPKAASYGWDTDTLWVDEAPYPILHCYIESIRMQHSPVAVVGLPRSNLDVGMIGIVRARFRKQFEDKLSKLSRYRARVPDGAPLVLLIWSSGASVTQHFDPRTIDVIREEVRKLSALSKDRFDDVWFGADLMMETLTVGNPRFDKIA